VRRGNRGVSERSSSSIANRENIESDRARRLPRKRGRTTRERARVRAFGRLGGARGAARRDVRSRYTFRAAAIRKKDAAEASVESALGRARLFYPSR
jgi:hypothetical protein